MADSSMYTHQQAADPTTPQHVLAEIARDRPDLRAAVAGNPHTYPDLLTWLGTLGDADVEVAIAARAVAPTQVLPTQARPPVAATPPAYSPQGAPPVQQPYGAPLAQQPYGTPPKKTGLGTGAIIGIIIGALVLVGMLIGGIVLAVALLRGGDTPEPGSYGSDAALDALWDQCEAGNMQACDDLYMEAPFFSDYEDFGSTCGGTEAQMNGNCVSLGSDPMPDETTGDADSYGSDPYLDSLWDSCAAGDMVACDNLYMESPLFSGYEAFGNSCGGTQSEMMGSCATLSTDTDTSTDAWSYGDDAYLDGLWDMCAAGDMVACDDLFFASAVDSDYETFGDTCGGRQAADTGDYCAPFDE